MRARVIGLIILFGALFAGLAPWLVRDQLGQHIQSEDSRPIFEFSLPSFSSSGSSADNRRAIEAAARVKPELEAALSEQGLKFGAPIFIRIFKEESELEVWIENDAAAEPNDRWKLFRTYEICRWSGDLGPKLKEGDRQAPEGFYFVVPSRMNPQSRYHLAFDMGFPNEYDQAHDRTGSYLMVHGNCVSIGCYAMTDEKIEEIYTLADAAMSAGQTYFRVHAFPFRMTDERMETEWNTKAEWIDFWKNLKEGYDYFEMTGSPPNVTVEDKMYVFE